MKITSVEGHEFAVGYIEPWAHDKRFYVKADTQANVVVCIKTDEGLLGIGEATHAPGVYGETVPATLGALELLANTLEGENPLQITRINALLDRVSLSGNIAARSGIDMAIHDLAGKILGVPLYQLLGGRVHETVPTHQSPALTDDAPEHIAEYLSMGTKYFKLKMSSDLSYDMPMVAKVLKVIKGRAVISLDVNQGWTVHETLRMARFIEKLDDFVDNVILEQPVGARDVEGLARVTQSTSVRVMADDGIRTMDDLIRVLQLRAADIVSLKISRVGGIQRVQQMVAVAEAHYMPYIIDEINENRIANTAVAHVATASRRPLYTGVASHTHHDRDVVTEGGVQIVDGHAVVSDAPGLGITSLAIDL